MKAKMKEYGGGDDEVSTMAVPSHSRSRSFGKPSWLLRSVAGIYFIIFNIISITILLILLSFFTFLRKYCSN